MHWLLRPWHSVMRHGEVVDDREVTFVPFQLIHQLRVLQLLGDILEHLLRLHMPINTLRLVCLWVISLHEGAHERAAAVEDHRIFLRNRVRVNQRLDETIV